MFFLYLAIIVFVLDRITKIIVTKILLSSESLPVIHRIFSITLVKNTGSAFGFLPQATKFFVWFSILAIIIIVIFLFRLKKKDFFVKFSLALIMGGALGNLFDRLAFGYVIDFLDFKIWPVFNLADFSISVGCLLLLFKMFTSPKELKKNK
jgi:signal peptidase II